MQQLREWWPGAVAGLVAAAVALAVAEFVARLVDGESLVVAIGDVIIDSSPRSVSGAAIETFGTNDKPALLVGIVATSLLLGAALGPLAMRYRAIGVAALAVFALVGGLVGARDPFTSPAQAWTTALAAGIAGAATLLLLLNAATQAGPSAAAAPPDPQEKRLGRRRFLQFAGGGLAAAAVSVPLGRRLIGPAVDVEAQRAAIVLPPPSTSTPASRPAGAATAALPSPTPSVSAPPKATATAETAPAEATPTATAAAEATPTATARAEATPTATVTPDPTPEPTPEPAPVVRAGPATVPGISPLVTPNSKFYRIDTALSVPRIDSTRWRLQLTGMVDRPAEFTFDELLTMSLREESVTLACVSNRVGQGLVGNAYWLGVPLPTLLREAGVQASATQVIGRAVDGFTVGFPTDVALDGRESMVVVGMNGEPLPAEHGFPARLIVPGLYGYVSATKWLGEIELSTLDSFDSYWVRRGWAQQAPIKLQSRIDVPHAGATLAPGNVRVAGVAWGGLSGVSGVQVRPGERSPGAQPSEGGWIDAVLSEELSDSSWRQWVVDWPATKGAFRLEVRAIDRSGMVQTAEQMEPFPDGATGHHTIAVTVEG